MQLPKEVQKFLKTKDFHYHKETYTYDEEFDDLDDKVSDLVLEIINPYYKKHKRGIPKNGLFNILLEPIKNSNFYTLRNTDNKATMELFLSPFSIIARCFDGGDYFKREDVKFAWENKLKHSEKQKVEKKGIGHGIGREYINEYCDLIYVDILKGHLYIGIDFEKNLHFKIEE